MSLDAHDTSAIQQLNVVAVGDAHEAVHRFLLLKSYVDNVTFSHALTERGELEKLIDLAEICYVGKVTMIIDAKSHVLVQFYNYVSKTPGTEAEDFLKQADVVLICFSLADPSAFDKSYFWFEKACHTTQHRASPLLDTPPKKGGKLVPPVPMFLVGFGTENRGNTERWVNTRRIAKVAAEQGVPFFEVSYVTSENIKTLFHNAIWWANCHHAANSTNSSSGLTASTRGAKFLDLRRISDKLFECVVAEPESPKSLVNFAKATHSLKTFPGVRKIERMLESSVSMNSGASLTEHHHHRHRMFGLAGLPKDILVEIMLSLDVRSIVRLGLTCWRLYHISHHKFVWKLLCWEIAERSGGSIHYKALKKAKGNMHWRDVYRMLVSRGETFVDKSLPRCERHTKNATSSAPKLSWWQSNGPTRRTIRVLMLGLDGSGKTALLYRLRDQRHYATVPTEGFNIEAIQYRGVQWIITEVSGNPKMRQVWRQCFLGTRLLVWLVDSTRRDRFEESCQELWTVLEQWKPSAEAVALLVLCTKQDLPQAVPIADIKTALRLPEVEIDWAIVPYGIYVGGAGDVKIAEGLDWAMEKLLYQE